MEGGLTPDVNYNESHGLDILEFEKLMIFENSLLPDYNI